MSAQQRRQPVSYAEYEEVRRTGVFPLMSDPVRQGAKPFCYNCTHWTPDEDGVQGTCDNIDARRFCWNARIDFGGEAKRFVTGGLCDCPLHEHAVR